MTEKIEVEGLTFAPLEGDVKRYHLAAKAAADIIEKRARKAKELPPAIFQLNAAAHLIIGLANGLRQTNPEWHRNFLIELVNALIADQEELQRLVDATAATKH